MTEPKMLLLVLSVIIYCLYSAHMWFAEQTSQETNSEVVKNTEDLVRTQFILEHVSETAENSPQVNLESEPVNEKATVKKKFIKLYYINACSILQVFTVKPVNDIEQKKDKSIMDNNAITALGITIFLLVLVINAVLDTLKAKEEENAKRKLNPNGERRHSLAEFANKKSLRRDSSKFGLQLFQIAETMLNSEEKKERQHRRPYTRGDSTNSYLSENKHSQATTDSPTGEANTECRSSKRQSVSKLFAGARSRSMERRPSFPALPLNPEIQSMVLGHRQPSVDSDDEDKGRRVRIIRRF